MRLSATPRLTGADANPLPIRLECKRELRLRYDAAHLLLEQLNLLVENVDALARGARA